MNFTLFLLLLIALIIILLSIILYNGIKIELFSEKEENNFKFKIKLSILKINIFTQEYPDNEDKEKESLKNKLNEIKAILKELKDLKTELKEFIINVFKDTDFKQLNGNLKLGLKDYAKTAKIMGWIWSFNAVTNTLSEPLNLNAEPHFDKEIMDFKIHAIIKINLLYLIFRILKLLSNKKIRTLIKNIFKNESNGNKKEESIS